MKHLTKTWRNSGDFNTNTYRNCIAFSTGKNKLQNKRQIQQILCSETYSCNKVIPLSRIRAYVTYTIVPHTNGSQTAKLENFISYMYPPYRVEALGRKISIIL